MLFAKIRMNGNDAINNVTLKKGYYCYVFKETDCDIVYCVELPWVWLKGRNSVSNNVTRCMNVSQETMF